MGTPRTSTNVRLQTVVLPALLAGIVEFGWFALFAASVAVVAFSPSLFSLSSLMLCTFFFSVFSPVPCLRGKEEGTLFLSVVVASLPFVVPSVLGVLLVMYL